MKAGFSKSEIVFPKEMFPLEGFSGIHDNPCVRMMYLKAAEETFAVVSIELVNVPLHLITFAKQCVCARLRKTFPDAPVGEEKVWVQMTHAITTPHEPGVVRFPWEQLSDERIQEQKALFTQAVTDAITEAAECLPQTIEDARLGFGETECFANRNRDIKTPFGYWIGEGNAGYSDHTMQLLKVEAMTGELLGVLFNFAIKPCAIDNAGLREGKRMVSSECTGLACKKVEEALQVPVIFTMSAAGDQIPEHMSMHEDVDEIGNVTFRDEGVSAGFQYALRTASVLAESVMSACSFVKCGETAPAVACHKSISLSLRRRKIEPKAPCPELFNADDGTIAFEGSLFKLDQVCFVAVKPEINAKTLLGLKSIRKDIRIILLSMTNGEMKYMPDRESYENATWEAQSSPFMPGAAEQFTEEVRKELSSL